MAQGGQEAGGHCGAGSGKKGGGGGGGARGGGAGVLESLGFNRGSYSNLLLYSS
jgi:hypothetical protein